MKLLASVFLCTSALAQQHVHSDAPAVPLQPLAQQVRQLEEALVYLGQPLSTADHRRINDAIAKSDEAAAVGDIQAALDPYVLINVDINPEGRVKVEQGAARPELVE